MKVLWVTPNIIAGLNVEDGLSQKSSGGWIKGSIHELIQSNCDFNILTINEKIPYQKQFINGYNTFWIKSKRGVFSFDKKVNLEIIDKIKEIDPDIIDIQGCEFCYAHDIVNEFPDKTVITLQGIISNISIHYFSCLSFFDIFKCLTIRDLFTFSSILSRSRRYKKRGYYEILALKKCKYIIGRTSWDKDVSSFYNSDMKYFKKYRAISHLFTEKTWSQHSCLSVSNKFVIFVSQGHIPIKGLHVLVDAINHINLHFNYKITVIVTGRSSLSYNKFFDSNYDRLLRKKINKYNLNNVFKFKGPTSQTEMVDYMLKSNLFIQPSLIENSPNSSLEAVALGMPVLLSDVGGTKDLLEGSGAIFYRPDDYQLLALEILKFINNEYSINDIIINHQSFINNYNLEYNEQKLYEIYKSISSYF